MKHAVIDFHGSRLVSALDGETVLVAMRPVAEALGLDWSAQRQRIMRHPIPAGSVVIITTEGTGGERNVLTLPAKMLHGWLFGVRTSMVKPDLRDRLLAFQRECFDALDAYWRRGVVVNPRFRTIEDSVGVYDDQRMTQGQRFHKERLRIEQVYGLPFDKASGMSRKRIKLIEELDASLGTKAELYDRLLSIGMDLQYVRRGERTLTPAERAVRDTMRLAGPEARRMLIDTTERLNCDKGILADPNDPEDFPVDAAAVEHAQHARVIRKTRLH